MSGNRPPRKHLPAITRVRPDGSVDVSVTRSECGAAMNHGPFDRPCLTCVHMHEKKLGAAA